MQFEDVIGAAEVVSVKDAARLLDRHENTIRRQLRSGQLVGKHWGRDWMIPMFRDDEGRAVFLVRGAAE